MESNFLRDLTKALNVLRVQFAGHLYHREQRLRILPLAQ